MLKKLNELLHFPYTWGALAVMASGSGYLVFNAGITNLLGWGLVAATVSLGFVSWWGLATHTRLYSSYLERTRVSREQHNRIRLNEIQQELHNFGCSQGAQQAQLVAAKIDVLREMIAARLESGELAFGRFRLAAEQVYLNAIDSLAETVITLNALKGIDHDYIQSRLSQESSERERKSLQQRIEFFEGHQQRLTGLLTYTEEMLTALDHTSHALAENPTGKTFADVSPDTALEELRRMAGMAHQYARR